MLSQHVTLQSLNRKYFKHINFGRLITAVISVKTGILYTFIFDVVPCAMLLRRIFPLLSQFQSETTNTMLAAVWV